MFLSQSITCRNLHVWPACDKRPDEWVYFIKPGPISTVVQDTISDRHEYANLTWIRFGMANLLALQTCCWMWRQWLDIAQFPIFTRDVYRKSLRSWYIAWMRKSEWPLLSHTHCTCTLSGSNTYLTFTDSPPLNFSGGPTVKQTTMYTYTYIHLHMDSHTSDSSVHDTKCPGSQMDLFHTRNLPRILMTFQWA